VPISVLTSAPYDLPYGSSIWVRVTATNIIGSSVYGEGNGAIILTVPTAPLVENYVPGTTNTQITLAWPASQENGGTPILDYSISYAKVGEDYESLADGVTGLSYTATGLITGQEYKFIVRARNAEGYGDYSEEDVILAGMIPDPPLLPITDFLPTPDRVSITWNAPYDRGAPILGYKILIQKADGVYDEELTNCDGSDPTIIAALSCDIPASALLATPHELPWGATVYTKVVAYNLLGDSHDSPIASNTFIRTKPDAPVLVLKQRGVTEMELEWAEPFDGGAPIIDYRISYD
jgi:hypothetical protein